MTNENRTRTITWQDPLKNIHKIPEMSGLQFLQAVLIGEIPPPPISETLNFYLTSVEEGRVVFTGEPSEFHYNPIGSVHAGFAATLLDSCMSCAIQTKIPQGMAYTTLELKVNLVRPLMAKTGNVQAVGKTLHSGRRTATAEGKIIDTDGKLYAHGTTTCFIFPL